MLKLRLDLTKAKQDNVTKNPQIWEQIFKNFLQNGKILTYTQGRILQNLNLNKPNLKNPNLQIPNNSNCENDDFSLKM